MSYLRLRGVVLAAPMDYLIPSRRERPGDDPIFSLNAEAKARAAAGELIANATIGALLDDDGKLALMSSVVDALKTVSPTVAAAYAPIPGSPDFREAVKQDLLGEAGLAQISTAVATPGGLGALRMAIDDFLEAGQSVLTSSFFWGPYRTLSDEAGRKLATYNMFAEDGRFDAADLDAQMGKLMQSQGRVLLFLNTPCHNPTGYSLDATEWEATVEVLKKHAQNGPVIALIDVAYSNYAEEGLSVAIEALREVINDVLVLFAWSASKSFAQYGLRVGSLVAVVPDEAQRKRIDSALTFSCRGLWSNCNAKGMAAITQMLCDPEKRAQSIAERKQLVAMLAQRVACWNELASAAGLNYPRYAGGFFTTVFCEDAASVAAELRKEGVFLVPLKGALRVAMCSVTEPQIKRIVDALKKQLG